MTSSRKAKPKPKSKAPPLPVSERRILVGVRRAFRALAPASTLLPVTSKGNRYELYTYLCLAEVIEATARNFHIHNPNGGTTFQFKCSPTAVSNAYSFCTFHQNGRDYELRNGIEYAGHQMRHEIDIAISTPLAPGTYPHPHELRFAVECKYFADLNGLKGQLRGLVGGVLDLSPPDPARPDCLLIGAGFQSHFACQHSPHQRTDFIDFLLSYRVAPLFNFHPAGKDMPLMRQWVQDFCRILW
ncbi:MAG: hypothetical protein ACRYFX_17845 [Janthinobacterium lividum]